MFVLVRSISFHIRYSSYPKVNLSKKHKRYRRETKKSRRKHKQNRRESTERTIKIKIFIYEKTSTRGFTLALATEVLIIESLKVHNTKNHHSFCYQLWEIKVSETSPGLKPAMARPSPFLSISEEKSNIPHQFVQSFNIRSVVSATPRPCFLTWWNTSGTRSHLILPPALLWPSEDLQYQVWQGVLTHCPARDSHKFPFQTV